MAFDPRTKEERKLFPFWTLIVIAGCAALWVFGAKIYQESMAAYRSYAAITQNAALPSWQRRLPQEYRQ